MALKFESIKNLFITEEKIEETKVEEKVSNQEKTTVNQVNPEIKKEETSSGVNWKKTSSGNSVVSETVEAKQVAKGEINEQILDSLTKALMNANLPGEDYLEFMQAYRAMKDIPLEENIKIQTVLATLSTRGLTTQKVFESADYYISILENEKRKFYTIIEEQAKGGINVKKKKILDLETLNKEKADQIAAITLEIQKNQEQIDAVKKENAATEEKIKTTEMSFIATFEHVVGQIKENVQKVRNIAK